MCVRMRVYADKLKIINNHVNEKRKRRRTSSWQAQRIILCLLYFNSEKQTQYYDICGFSCCCCIAFYEENHYADADVCASVCFFLSVSFFFHLVCFCCFSLAVEPQAQMTATARANDGLVGIKFFVIPCVHYHIFRFSSWWIFDACRHCTSVSWHQNVLNVLYDRAQLLANGKLFFLLFFLEKNINFCVCSLTNWINKHLIFWIVALKLGTKYEEKNCANSNTVVINHCDFTWFQEREKTNVSKVFIYRD